MQRFRLLLGQCAPWTTWETLLTVCGEALLLVLCMWKEGSMTQGDHLSGSIFPSAIESWGQSRERGLDACMEPPFPARESFVYMAKYWPRGHGGPMWCKWNIARQIAYLDMDRCMGRGGDIWPWTYLFHNIFSGHILLFFLKTSNNIVLVISSKFSPFPPLPLTDYLSAFPIAPPSSPTQHSPYSIPFPFLVPPSFFLLPTSIPPPFPHTQRYDRKQS